MGVLLVGVFGLTLVGVGLLEEHANANSTAIRVALEILKYGGILYILHLAIKTFL